MTLRINTQHNVYFITAGFNPRWDCTVSFQLQVPDLALVRFVVEDHDHTSKNDFVGQFTLPFNSLRTGVCLCFLFLFSDMFKMYKHVVPQMCSLNLV